MMTDAICYESAIRFPTDVKLLWESVDWVYRQLKLIVKYLKGRMPGSKYDRQNAVIMFTVGNAGAAKAKRVY